MGFINKMITRLRAYKFLVNYSGSYLHETGWLKSLQSGIPTSPTGDPLPWMNYSLIAFLDHRLSAEMTVFEYGSGSSTLYFARKVRSVTSVEYDKNWYEKLNQQAPDDVKFIFQEADVDGKYCRAIHNENVNYDIVIVDGKDRVNCVREGFMKLNDSGVLILDDSNRPDYEPGFELAVELGYRTLHFEGLKPTDFITETATIFYRSENCFSI